MISHGILWCGECYSSIWLIVDAINTNPDFDMEFSKNDAAQEEIAHSF
jgi:hypothetical protein